MAERALEVYLQDHWAGATAGAELANRIVDHYAGAEVETQVRSLAADIDADRESLAAILDRLGVDRSAVKAAMGWLGEKAARLKLGPLTGQPQLVLFMELEALSLGISGKLALWRALEVAFAPEALPLVDLDDLARRAEEQRAFVEGLRLDEGRAVLHEQ
ncbi:MAG TPA: hypothetical protein VGN59_07875 [Acidimicrobiia bacterium]|jgi:hypothetical protein